MKRKELIAEILTELKSYDETGLIDYRNLNRWIKSELKRFGANLMPLTEKIIEVKNGKAEVPENFYSLYYAVKCTPEYHEFEEGCMEKVQSSHYWTQRLETTYEWDNQSNSHKGKDFKCIEEKVYFNDCAIKIRYTRPQLLKLTRGFNKEYFANKCQNIKVTYSPYEMNIVRDTINFNFKEGFVYMQYYGLPTDEDGDLYIPEVRSLIEYLIAYCRRKILETLFYNDDDVNVVNKIQLAKQDERELFGLAMTQVKMESLGQSDWVNRIRRKIISESNRFERMFPNH